MNNIIEYNECVKTCKEMENMRLKLIKAIPSYIIGFMCVTFGASCVFLCLLAIQFFMNIIILHLYYSLTGLIGFFGLFLTAALILKDWKGFINETTN